MSGTCYGASWEVDAFEEVTNTTLGRQTIKENDFLTKQEASAQLGYYPVGSYSTCYEQTGKFVLLFDS